MTVRLRDLLLGLRDLHLGNAPVIVHSSLKSFGQVEDGAETVVNALGSVFATVMMPTFTYKAMVIPLTGPDNNAITYGSGADLNRRTSPVSGTLGYNVGTIRVFTTIQNSNLREG